MTTELKKTQLKEYEATHRFARISASKVRLVAKMVKGLSVEKAVSQLSFMDQKSSKMILKVLKSASANAVHNFGENLQSLVVSRLEIGEGPTLKRFRARSRGMANRINKRTSHIKVVLGTSTKAEAQPKNNKNKKKASVNKVDPEKKEIQKENKV